MSDFKRTHYRNNTVVAIANGGISAGTKTNILIDQGYTVSLTANTSFAGSFCGYSFPDSHPGQASPPWRVGCATVTWLAPVYAAAAFLP